MRVPTRGRQHGLQFNITPLIDIVFLLIIFFLVASYLSRNENSDQIQLAEAATGNYAADEAPTRVVLTVPVDQSLHLAGRQVTLDEFRQALQAERDTHRQELEVRIRADRRVPYCIIDPLLTTCATAGIRKVRFHVLQE